MHTPLLGRTCTTTHAHILSCWLHGPTFWAIFWMPKYTCLAPSIWPAHHASNSDEPVTLVSSTKGKKPEDILLNIWWDDIHSLGVQSNHVPSVRVSVVVSVTLHQLTSYQRSYDGPLRWGRNPLAADPVQQPSKIKLAIIIPQWFT